MRLRGFVISGASLLFTFCGGFAQTQIARNISMTANSDGYYEYLPQGYNSGNQNYPLILSIHGAGELGNVPLSNILGAGLPALINQGQFPASFTVNGQAFSFIVISPHFNPNWPIPADIQEIIDYVVQHYRVDQTRIYMTGLSMGGGVTWDYAGGSSVFANRLAAIVPIAGASWPEPARGRVIANANLPVWATHNNGDQIVPVTYTNDYITNINESPSPTPIAKKSIFISTDHDAWTQTYDPAWTDSVSGGPNIYEWMLQYQRNSNGNLPPTANVGQSQTISLPTSQITIAGSGIANNGGSIISHTWTKLSGGFATITTPSSYGTTVTGLSTGTYVFRLTITQDDNQIASGNVTVTVLPTPPPTANAGTSQTITLPANQITLSGTGTANNSGSIISHVWTKLSSGSATITDPSSYSTTVTGLTAGTYIFRLTVTQNNNLTATSDVTVTVNPVPKNIPGKVEAENWDVKSGPQYAVATTDVGGGQQVIGIANGSWMDYNVTVVQSGTYTANFRVATVENNVQFQVKLGTTVLGTMNVSNTGGWNTWVTIPVSNILLTAGLHTIRIICTSNQSCNFNWTDWILTAPSTAPVADAGSPQTILSPTATQVTLSGNGTANNGGSLTSHVWTKLSGGSATVTDPSGYNSTVTGLSVGTYIFRLTVTQDDNQTATADVTITVNLAPPTANVWTGAVNTAWENSGNWSCGLIPDCNTDVFINSGTLVVNSNAVCRTLSLMPGVNFNINTGFIFTITH
jgi:dienelactone hydrolase